MKGPSAAPGVRGRSKLGRMAGLVAITLVILGAIAVGVWVLFRSIRRWQLPAPSSEVAKQAEARLWSTRNLGER